MYNILIKNREEAIRYSYNKDIDECIIISINDSEIAEFNNVNNKIKDVLSLVFHDIKRQTPNGILMSKDHAKQVQVFIDKYKNDVQTIVIHCHAGISRSAALACAISMYLNGDDIEIWGHGDYYPNEYCYILMLEQFGINLSKEDIRKRYDINTIAFNSSENASIINSMFVIEQ
jgi:hypothetical protein